MPCALRGYEFEHFVLRANNLRPKLKQLNVVLTTVDTTKQGVEGVSVSNDAQQLCGLRGRS